MKKILTLLIIFVLLVLAVLLIRQKQQAIAHVSPPKTLPVVVQGKLVRGAPVTLTLPASAEVQADEESTLSSRLSAYVTTLSLREGDHFRRGDVLVRLDSSQAQASLASAQADLAQSRLQKQTLADELAAARTRLQVETEAYERLQSLHRIGGVSLEELQAGEARVAQARAAQAAARSASESYRSLLGAKSSLVRAATENLRYGVIRAPFDGVLSERFVEPGDLATPGKPLLKVQRPEAGVRLLLDLPVTMQPLALRVAGETLPLQPWPEAGAQGLRRFEARSTNSGLLAGTRQPVDVVVFREQAIALSESCMLNGDGESATVLLLQGKTAKSLRIDLLAEGREGAATNDPRLEGQRLACASPDILTRLAAGAPFRLQPAQE